VFTKHPIDNHKKRIAYFCVVRNKQLKIK